MTNAPEVLNICETPIQTGETIKHEGRTQRQHSRVPRCPLRDQHQLGTAPCVPQAQPSMLPEWMDLKTTQEYVAVSDRTLREWIHREHDPLPAVQDGGKIFISRSRLDRWMLSHAITSESNRPIADIVDDVMASLVRIQ